MSGAQEKTLLSLVEANDRPTTDFPPPCNPINGEVCTTIDDLLTAADIYAAQVVNAKAQIDVIKLELWDRSGGDDPTKGKTRHIQGEMRRGKMEAAPANYSSAKLRSILEAFSEGDLGVASREVKKLIVPSGYRLSMTPWGMLLRTTTDDSTLAALIEEIKKAEGAPGLPSLKVDP